MHAAAHYEMYWGLSASPFTNHAEPQWLYQSPTHEEALSRLGFVAEQSRRTAVLQGAAGTGKTILLRALRTQWRGMGRELAVVDLTGRTDRDLLWELGEAFGLGLSMSVSTFDYWARVREFIQGHTATHRPVFIAIDNATSATEAARDAVVRLSNLNAGAPGLTVLLTTRKLDDTALPTGFVRNCDLRVRLEPLDLRETHTYVHALLGAAGRSEELFEHEAIDEIHGMSHGIPRDINRLCDLALLAGCLDEAERVSDRMVTSIAGEALPKAALARRYDAALIE